MMSWQLDELARQAEGVLSDEHSRGRLGDSIGYGANDESTRSQREYSVDAKLDIGCRSNSITRSRIEGRHVTHETVQCQCGVGLG